MICLIKLNGFIINRQRVTPSSSSRPIIDFPIPYIDEIPTLVINLEGQISTKPNTEAFAYNITKTGWQTYAIGGKYNIIAEGY